MDNIYNKDSIESLSPLEHVRLRPGMYVGVTDDATQLALEIISNSIDEFNIGHGNRIDVSLSDDCICISDHGQGFPINEKREDGKTVLEAAFSVVNTSGKFREDGVYSGSSVGLNGLGAKISNFLSHWFEVISWQNYKYEHLWFKEGVLEKRECGKWGDDSSGTTVTFQPSEEFFDNPTANEKKIFEYCDDITCICHGLTICFQGAADTILIQHDNGIIDLLKKHLDNQIEIVNNRFVFNHVTTNNKKIDFALSYTTSTASNFTVYVNCGLTSAGPHITGMKSVITRVLNKWAKDNNILSTKDKNLDGTSLQEGLVLVCNITIDNVAYDAQTKTRVSKIDSTFISSTLGEQFEIWLDQNPDDARSIIEKALIARKAAEAAKKARERVKSGKQDKKEKAKILNPDKLKDAEFLGEDSTLLVVEGLSAGASIASARDRSKYGILMLRGKLINALSNDEDKLLKNEEIQLLFKALGFAPGNYDSSRLRYGKLAICTDADSDGFHIGLLIMAAVQFFCPQFIQEERLCWLRSPLYIVKQKDKEYYFFNDEEMNAARGKVSGEVSRAKGLGALSVNQAKESMFGPNQRMDTLIADDDSILLLEELMGKSVTPRKDFIFNHIDFSEVKE